MKAELNPAFTMSHHDRFHNIMVADPVRFDNCPNAATILTFFVIRRGTGLLDIIHILKTFNGGHVVSRQIQSKERILEADIEEETAILQSAFSNAVEKHSGKKLNWDTLDLSQVHDMQEQIRRIQAWGKVSSTTALSDLPPLN